MITDLHFPRCHVAAWGTVPGIKSWYRSKYASVPKVQMHELGHVSNTKAGVLC